MANEWTVRATWLLAALLSAGLLSLAFFPHL